MGFVFSAVVTEGFSCPVGAGLGALEIARDVGESVKFELVCSPHSCDAEDPSESAFDDALYLLHGARLFHGPPDFGSARLRE